MLEHRAAGLACGEWDADQRKPELLLSGFEKLFDAPFFQKVFETSFLAIAAITVLRKHPYHRSGDGDRFGRPNQQPGIARKIAMTSNASELHAEKDTHLGRSGEWRIERGERLLGYADG